MSKVSNHSGSVTPPVTDLKTPIPPMSSTEVRSTETSAHLAGQKSAAAIGSNVQTRVYAGTDPPHDGRDFQIFDSERCTDCAQTLRVFQR